MGITVLTAIAAVSVSALYVLAGRSAIHSALAGGNASIPLHDPAAETLVGHEHESHPTTDWHLTTLNNLSQARDLLDSIEAHGYHDREMVVVGNSTFAVRWR